MTPKFRLGILATIVPLGALAAVTTSTAARAAWEAVPAGGLATSIGVGQDGNVWVTGNSGGGSPNGNYVFQLQNNETQWSQLAGAAGIHVAVSPTISAPLWVLNEQGNIWQWNGSSWTRLPGCAKSIAVDANGNPWTIGCTAIESEGNAINQWVPSPGAPPGGPLGAWSQLPGAAAQISASPSLDGNVFVVNTSGNTWRYNRSSSSFDLEYPGCVSEVAAGPNDDLWAIGCTSLGPNGNAILHFDKKSNAWATMPGAAQHVAVSANGTPWVVNVQGNIFEWKMPSSTSTGIMYEAVSAYPGTESIAGMVPSCSGFQSGLLGAPNTIWTTAGNSSSDGNVFDTDFFDPDVSGNTYDDDTDNIDQLGTAIGMYCGHGLGLNDTNAEVSQSCNTAADCPPPDPSTPQFMGPATCVSWPGLESANGKPGMCRYWFQPAQVLNGNVSEHGQVVTFGQLGGPAFGESRTQGNPGWAEAGTNGGVNAVFYQQSFGAFPNHYYTEFAGLFAGVHLFGTTMPIAGDTNGGGADVGPAFASLYVDNPNGGVAYSWATVATQVADTFNGYGCTIAISVDASASMVTFHVYDETWATLQNDLNDGSGEGFIGTYYGCNYDLNQYPISL